ncbi:MAG: mobile mystery protein A [Pseudolabrys sp.]|nr:mobile mystery protein A [Pseudolabrys sp.]
MARPEQLDKRFEQLRVVTQTVKPARGWIRAIRETLGMTTAQLASRMGVKQPRIIELEKAEATGNITLTSLERAAEALGCRLVYTLVPHKPLADTLHERALLAARKSLAAVEQTMRLESQEVSDMTSRADTERHLVEQALRKPARLWDEP